MPNLNLVSARLVDVPNTNALMEYVVAGNGLFVQAKDSRMDVCVPVATAVCPGLPHLEPSVLFKMPFIPAVYLTSVWQSALRHMPNEAAYQFIHEGALPWQVVCPDQHATPASVDYLDAPEAVVDLHSHGALPAFFSETDNQDEGGLRIYCVIGEIASGRPQLLCRVGVYGHHWPIPAEMIFEGLGPFTDMFDKEIDL